MTTLWCQGNVYHLGRYTFKVSTYQIKTKVIYYNKMFIYIYIVQLYINYYINSILRP